MRRAAILLSMFVALPALAEERLDHRGALGLSIAGGVEHASVLLLSNAPTQADANRWLLELDPSFAVGTEGNELVATLRFLRGPDSGAALGFAYRSYFGRDEWKTYFQGGLKADTSPYFGIGPAGLLGVMYELTPLAGVYAQAGLSFEAGHGLRVGFEGSAGIQLRTFVLE